MEINDLSPWLLLVAPVIIVIAYTVFGLSGFGSTVSRKRTIWATASATPYGCVSPCCRRRWGN